MVFGVIIFLRLGWIVGQAGLSTTLAIISLATLIAMLTTLSMASISTNISVGKGGVYYLISRSLGIEAGSAIGIPLYIKQCLSIAFCVIGFAESLHDLVPSFSITNIGVVSLLVLTLLAYFSLSGALKVQVFIFVAIIASLISLFLGSGETMVADPDNFVPAQPKSMGFWSIFAIFFPAMTGIESSVSLSGDLKNPARSLPLGTISALLVAYLIYLLIPIFLVQQVSYEMLVADPFIMQALAKVPQLIILGIWGATISSALGGLLGAPRTLQALADDGVVPKFLGKTYGSSNNPRIATLATSFLSLICIYFGSVNIIAPLLTMICLICYSFLNFSAGLETLMDNPSWRPRFRIHWTVSILGAILCLMAMIMIDPGYAIISVGLVLFIYLVCKRRDMQNSWDDIRQGILLYFSRFALYRLAHGEKYTKSWRPHFLVFAKTTEGSLLHFSQAITRGKGFITMASFVSQKPKDLNEKEELKRALKKDLKEQNIQAFIQITFSEKIYHSMQLMIENYGLGPLSPNTVVCGSSQNAEDLENLAILTRKAHRRHHNMIILNSQMDSIDSKIPSGDIHLWWDSKNKENGELMTVLAYMLKRNKAWKKAKICLKTIVSCELERAKVQKEFEELSHEKRIPIDIQIFVSSNPEEDYLKYPTSFSKDAALTMLNLAPPTLETAEYAQYLKQLVNFSQEFKHMAFVLSAENTPLRNILD
jgi:amino acid transporter